MTLISFCSYGRMPMGTNSVKNKLRTLTFERGSVMSSWRGHVAFLIGIAMFSGAAGAAEQIEVQSNPIPGVPKARPAEQPLTGVLYRPSGTSGPVPAVIVLHTCAGIGNGYLLRRWADRLNAWGYAAFVLDSFGPRHTNEVCAQSGPTVVSVLDRAGDAINAAIALRSLPGIDGNRIGAIGMSHGGATAATLTGQAFQAYQPGLIKAAVDYYGSCNFPQAHGTTPLLALAGEADDWGYPARTCAAFQQALRPDQVMELHTYPGVYHSFDNDRLVNARTSHSHRLQYDHDAAEDSFARTHVFLDHYVRDAR
jgi:dienelactone hydrolase